MSTRPPLSSLTPDEFLHTFIDEARDLAPFSSCTSLQSFIHQIVFKASACLEGRYREIENLRGALVPEQYARLIVNIKNSIGGKFSVVSSDQLKVRIHAGRCPFGDVRRGMSTILNHPWIPTSGPDACTVRGFIYDVDTGKLEEVTYPGPMGSFG